METSVAIAAAAAGIGIAGALGALGYTLYRRRRQQMPVSPPLRERTPRFGATIRTQPMPVPVGDSLQHAFGQSPEPPAEVGPRRMPVQPSSVALSAPSSRSEEAIIEDILKLRDDRIGPREERADALKREVKAGNEDIQWLLNEIDNTMKYRGNTVSDPRPPKKVYTQATYQQGLNELTRQAKGMDKMTDREFMMNWDKFNDLYVELTDRSMALTTPQETALNKVHDPMFRRSESIARNQYLQAIGATPFPLS